MSEGDRDHRQEVRAYYRTVSRFIDRELTRRGDADFWSALVGEPGAARVLELGAGTGRVTCLLARRAASVVGVDLSREMLEKARERVGRERHVHLVVADMRTLRLRRRFELVVAADDPFVHLSRPADRQRTLETVRRHLAPGGRFVLDAHRLSRRRVREFRSRGEYVRERTLGPDDDPLTIREHWTWFPETTRCVARYEYVREGTVVDEATFRARLWTVEELEARLPRAGLEITNLWGDYDFTPFDAGSSRHILVEAVRADRPRMRVPARRTSAASDSNHSNPRDTMPSRLTEKHCEPCDADTPPLEGAELTHLEDELSARWTVEEEHHLVGEFEFDDFLGALKFTNEVGELAEDEGHHPEICLTWGRATVKIWTHAIDGLSENDFILAAKIDELEAET